MKYIFVCLAFICLWVLTNTTVDAKKKIVLTTNKSVVVSSNRVIIRPRLRPDRKALIINFSNLKVASKVEYELNYDSAGITQGVVGEINSNTSKELFFGTCSRTVCRVHSNLSNMKLVVTSTLNNGTRVRKTYRVKI